MPENRPISRAAGSWSKPQALLAAGILALAALVILVALGIAGSGSPLSQQLPAAERKPTSSSTLAVMVVLMPLLAAWGLGSSLRCFDSRVRSCLIACVVLMELWLLDVICKYCLHSDALTIAAWYLYYPPMLIVPLLMVFMALRVSELDAHAPVRALKAALAGASAVLALLVLSNNLHHLVFVFDPSDPSWGDTYTYGPVYYLIFALIVFELLGFIAVLIVNSCRQLHNAAAPIAFIGALALVYSVGYILRVPLVWTSNFSLVFVLFVTVLLELCFDSGLLPSFSRYAELATTLPFDLKLFSLSEEEGAEPLLVTSCAEPIGDEGLACVEACRTGSRAATGSAGQGDTVLSAQRVTGGVLLLTEDVSALRRRREELLRRQDALKRSCTLLERERAVAERLQQQWAAQQLAAEVEESISESLRRASTLIAEASQLVQESGEESQREAQRSLQLAKLLVSYSKRKGELVLHPRTEPEFEREKLQLIVGELVADLQAAGVECAALIETAEALDAALVSVLFDCLYDFAGATLFYEGSALMIYIGSAPSGCLVLKLALETAEDGDLGETEEFEVLGQLLAASGASYHLESGEGTIRLSVTAQCAAGTGGDRP